MPFDRLETGSERRGSNISDFFSRIASENRIFSEMGKPAMEREREIVTRQSNFPFFNFIPALFYILV